MPFQSPDTMCWVVNLLVSLNNDSFFAPTVSNMSTWPPSSAWVAA